MNLTGSFVPDPVITASVEEETVSIKGKVDPVEARSWVYAIDESDTVSSTVTDSASGGFEFSGIKEGSYSVSIEPDTYSFNFTKQP